MCMCMWMCGRAFKCMCIFVRVSVVCVCVCVFMWWDLALSNYPRLYNPQIQVKSPGNICVAVSIVVCRCIHFQSLSVCVHVMCLCVYASVTSEVFWSWGLGIRSCWLSNLSNLCSVSGLHILKSFPPTHPLYVFGFVCLSDRPQCLSHKVHTAFERLTLIWYKLKTGIIMRSVPWFLTSDKTSAAWNHFSPLRNPLSTCAVQTSTYLNMNWF